MLTEHQDILKGFEGFASTDKLQSIAVESVEGYDSADNVIDGKGDALVENLPSMETKKPYSMEECSVSSGECGEKKQQPSLGDDINADEEMSAKCSVSSAEDAKEK